MQPTRSPSRSPSQEQLVDVDTSILLSQETVTSFDQAKKENFRQAVAVTLGVAPSHVIILKVLEQKQRRRLLQQQKQQAATTGIRVVFEIHADSKKEAQHIVEEIQADTFAKELARRLDKAGVIMSATEKAGLAVAAPTIKTATVGSAAESGGSSGVAAVFAVLAVLGVATAGGLMLAKHRRKLAARYREKQAATFSGNVILDPDLDDDSNDADESAPLVPGTDHGNVVHDYLA
jgi:hypothetical protein